LQRVARASVAITCTRANWSEVSAQRFECSPFDLDLAGCAETKAPQDRNRRAPALNGVLE
jgi:hypothetical protein